MTCEIKAEKLIRAVRARPALYDKSDSRFHTHHKYKTSLWKEVCREVFDNWDELRPSEKVEHDFELQKRWKNLRTCFTRELGLQKKEKKARDRGRSDSDDDQPFKKRKQYAYFNAMKFLLNHNEAEDSGDNSFDPINEEIKVENYIFHEAPRTSRNERRVTPMSRERSEERVYERLQQPNRSIEEKILDLLGDKKREEADEDRQFMLSLVPGFKKLSERQKFDAKIEILKVLQNISFQTDRKIDIQLEVMGT